MKRTLTRLIFVSTVLLCAGWALGAGPPLVVTHTVMESRAGHPIAAIDLAVHVVNPGDNTVTNLTLSFVSLPQLLTGRRTLSLGSLAPHQSIDLSLHLTGSELLDREKISHSSLLFAGKYLDDSGTPVEFPVTSNPGGAR